MRILTSHVYDGCPVLRGLCDGAAGDSSQVAVPALLAMQTIGSVGGAVLYTWLGARNNLPYIRLALIAAVLLPICALLAGVVGPLPLYFGFLVSGLAVSGNLFSSYLNWVVNYAHADQRPIYVGLSNTVSAVVSLIAPFHRRHDRPKPRLPPAIRRLAGDGAWHAVRHAALTGTRGSF